MSGLWLTNIIADRGCKCGNCGEWRILKKDQHGGLAIVEECSNCDDEEFDIYEVENKQILEL